MNFVWPLFWPLFWPPCRPLPLALTTCAMPSPKLRADSILEQIKTEAASIIVHGLSKAQADTLEDAKEEISSPRCFPADDYRGPKYGTWLRKMLNCEQTVLLVAAAVVRRSWIRRLPITDVLKLSEALSAHHKFEKLEQLAKTHFPESNTSTAPRDEAESHIIGEEYSVAWSQASVIELFDERFAQAVSCPDGRQITMIFPDYGFRCLVTFGLDLAVAKRLVQELYGFMICLEGEKPPAGGAVFKCSWIDLTGLNGDVIKEVLGLRLWEHIEEGPDRQTELKYGRAETECVRISVSHLNSCLSISISTRLGTEIRQRLE
ncbi:hypothetical protein IF1G_11089 [Cordyceps javanica]|uniref:Uncharacterized protein n=1 Tax=Cordyceps javanica TaxID=43265 RepID=A0A545ULB6_9HYPO|nr:hypothetical protein IF1G_11089 [Cordyceps javanica]